MFEYCISAHFLCSFFCCCCCESTMQSKFLLTKDVFRLSYVILRDTLCRFLGMKADPFCLLVLLLLHKKIKRGGGARKHRSGAGFYRALEFNLSIKFDITLRFCFEFLLLSFETLRFFSQLLLRYYESVVGRAGFQ